MNKRPAPWRRIVHRVTHSIKGRLVALFILLALGTTTLFLLGSQRWLQTGWQAFAQPLVADYAQRLASELGTPPRPETALALSQRLPIAVAIDGPQVQYQTHPERFEYRHRARKNHEDAAWTWAVQSADGHRIQFALAAPTDLDKPRFIGALTLAALLGLTFAAYATVRRQLRPLQDITTAVQRFGRGEFGQAIPVQRDDELGELAQRINTMAHSLHGMLDAKRALLLAMSHELRSPLTRARVNAELLDDSPERQALLRDLGEMRDLITSLLEGERLAAGHSALQTETVDLAALLHEAVDADAAAYPHAARAVVQIQSPRTTFTADSTRLRLLLRNLLHNAHVHGEGSAIEVFLRGEPDGRLALGVRDHGPGVAEDQVVQLAQAFYRPDSARSRASGGVGLGLYLCRLVAQAHGGELRLNNVQPGLEVAMVW